ncbi:Ribosomal protein L34Ae [Corchorus capsularis]|uniref:Ribosomal protein L34Ae n=1 Tax=Corchorus capsularis TaxID=210143 RepID=A0A1R3GP42_COCAP|nr:Ribosomal protein L34Ae [Corchorus capsularis]
MVQQLIYRTRHSYATKSNQRRIVKSPTSAASSNLLVESLFTRPPKRELADPNAHLLER